MSTWVKTGWIIVAAGLLLDALAFHSAYRHEAARDIMSTASILSDYGHSLGGEFN